MLERMLIVVAASVCVAAAAYLWQQWRAWRLSTTDAGDLAESQPTVLYFSADWCGQCRLQQQPIIERLLTTMSECFRLREVDVEAETDLARRFGVVTLPTTVVVSPSGRVVARNAGVTPPDTLNAQIQRALSTQSDC